ncbi:phospholipase D-like domain-containing protein [Granulicella cerasi]|uniref:phospholipase D n=1 Tax=Granulicella cerasi TaxID=741063 RepID=A0ABW1Z603_9BACT|nr:phospholipase D-like domain-containing protein [Granulicella cerasi]
MKLLVQPEDGIKPILDGLAKAEKRIRILIFRFDRVEIEKALVQAVERGVTVEALIAYTNQGEEKNLRKLEMRLLERGITVMRTNNDLVRYHGKMMIIDDRTLYIFGYNFTHLDIDLSRSFGIVTKKPGVVREAVRLFEADAHRKEYTSGNKDLVVSPVNARERLIDFVEGARKSLCLYEMKFSDREFMSLLDKKMSEGVEVRVLSRAASKARSIPVRKLAGRLHLRAIMRDGEHAFVGSQSLRRLELEARREIGITFRDSSVVAEMEKIFEKDWKKSEVFIENDALVQAINIPAKKVAKAVAKHVAVKPMIEQVLDKVVDQKDASFEPAEVAQAVREAFHEEMESTVKDVLRELVSAAAGAEVALNKK